MARVDGLRLHRLGLGTLLKPLLEQHCRSSAVQSTTAIAVQTMAFGRSP
jgi:hypothetical protein